MKDLSAETVVNTLLRMGNRAAAAGCPEAAVNYDAALSAYLRPKELSVSCHEYEAALTAINKAKKEGRVTTKKAELLVGCLNALKECKTGK